MSFSSDEGHCLTQAMLYYASKKNVVESEPDPEIIVFVSRLHSANLIGRVLSVKTFNVIILW